MDNWKQNIGPFYIGQKVVYITGNNLPKNSIHIVSDLMQDPCGCWSMAINGEKISLYKVENAEITDLICDSCKLAHPATMKHSDPLSCWDVTSFRAIEKAPIPLLTLSKIKETEKEEILIPN